MIEFDDDDEGDIDGIAWAGSDDDDEQPRWSFIDRSVAFVHGIEAGILYVQMRGGCAQITATTHSANQEELINLSRAMNYTATFDDLDDAGQWQTARFVRD